MSNTFPSSLNSFVTGSSSGTLGSVGHADAHNALEAKVGIDGSAIVTSLDYKLTNTASSNPGHKHTLAQGATDVTATYTELNYVSGVTSAIQTQINAKASTSSPTITTPTLTTPTMSSPVINTGVSGSAISTSTSLTENSDTILASQKAVKAYVDAKVLYRAFSWYLDGTAVTANEVGAKYIAPQAMTSVRVSAKTVSGTATIRIQKGTTDIVNSISVTSTIGHTTSFSSGAIAQYDVITLDITADSSCVGLTVTFECTQP